MHNIVNVSMEDKAMNIPKDPVILLSFINTNLRDHYSSIDDLCASLGVDRCSIEEKLSTIDYSYDSVTNQFIS